MTDSLAGAESFQSRGYHFPGTALPSAGAAPTQARQTALGALLPPPATAPRRAPPAEPSTPGDPSRWDRANSRRDSPPGVIRPSRLYRGDKRFEGRDSPSSSGGSEKARIQGPDSAPGRKRAGQTQSLGAERPAATPPPP